MHDQIVTTPILDMYNLGSVAVKFLLRCYDGTIIPHCVIYIIVKTLQFLPLRHVRGRLQALSRVLKHKVMKPDVEGVRILS